MSQAGKALALAVVAVCAVSKALAQTPPTPIPPPVAPAASAPTPLRSPAPTMDRESSVTVQQIVARQEDQFKRMQTAQGTAVHTETRYDAQGRPETPSTQYVFFAYAGNRSVTLALPQAAAQMYKSSQGQIAWNDVISACHVVGDTVYVIGKAKRDSSSTGPVVMAVEFNPAVHENNPLVRFHPRQISDEQAPLRELASAIPNMASRPKVYDIQRDGKQLLRIDFANDKLPGERLSYVIDPNRGYLPVEITRVSKDKPVSVSKITIGNTPDGTWIPARRDRTLYGASGQVVSRQSWHYEYFAINQKLPPKMLSLMYFNLPLSTPVTVVTDRATTGTAAKGAVGTPAATPAVATPRPMPLRSAPAPARINL